MFQPLPTFTDGNIRVQSCKCAVQAQRDDSLPALLVVVTGRGPLLGEYQAKLRRLALRRCAFRTAWLTPGDYPLLLGTADVGVCLHTSSSGLDLPMKVMSAWPLHDSDVLRCALRVEQGIQLEHAGCVSGSYPHLLCYQTTICLQPGSALASRGTVVQSLQI